jgi:hypothetical protein
MNPCAVRCDQEINPMVTSRLALGILALVSSACTDLPPEGEAQSLAPSVVGECDTSPPEWVWCDDFEADRMSAYFEYDAADGSFERSSGVGLEGSHGMRARFAKGQVSAGSLHLALGKTPQTYFRAVDDGFDRYRELYWRVHVMNETAWIGGGGNKLSRATSFASPNNWAQSMIAHVWSDGFAPDWNYLVLDPASGTDSNGRVKTTKYNDFENLRWLGARRGQTPIFDAAHVGEWYCIEAHVRLNDPGQRNGVFEYWIDGVLEGGRSDLDWVGTYEEYGLNAVFLENYWNAGSPREQERYFDDFVVSTERIGC